MVYDQSLLVLTITQCPSGEKRGRTFYVDGYVRGTDGSRLYWVINPPVEVHLIRDGTETYIGGGGGNPDGTSHTACTIPTTYDEGVTVTLRVRLPAGTYWIDSDVRDSEFPLQDYVYEKTATTDFVVKYDSSLTPPTVSIVGRESEGVVVRLSTRLTYTTTGSGIPNQTVYFYYRRSGETYTQLDNPKTTDSNGYVDSDTVTLSAGTYDFKAEYLGTLTVADCSAETTNYTITKMPTSLSLVVIVS